MVLWKKVQADNSNIKKVHKTNSKIEVRRKLKATASKVFLIPNNLDKNFMVFNNAELQLFALSGP